MDSLITYSATIVRGLRGDFGVVGLYGAVQRLFITFGVTAGPACFFIDAPFGRWSQSSMLSVNGNIGWLIMEIVSPLTFLVALTTSPASSSALASLTSDLPLRIVQAFGSLPRARALLGALFVTHYINRAIISTWRNPGRAEMNVIVPINAILFNLANGGMMGLYIAGGERVKGGNPLGAWGLKEASLAQIGFILGIGLWFAGFISNIVCDEMLYELKRAKKRSGGRTLNEKEKKKLSPKDRYSIPRGFLYEYVSHPAYSCEWLEWMSFTLASLCLHPSPFPTLAISSIHSPISLNAISQLFKTYAPIHDGKVPVAVQPLGAWYFQPPAVFVMQELLVMFPRAVSGHRWYQKTFGDDWPKDRKIVIPGLL